MNYHEYSFLFVSWSVLNSIAEILILGVNIFCLLRWEICFVILDIWHLRDCDIVFHYSGDLYTQKEKQNEEVKIIFLVCKWNDQQKIAEPGSY